MARGTIAQTLDLHMQIAEFILGTGNSSMKTRLNIINLGTEIRMKFCVGFIHNFICLSQVLVFPCLATLYPSES
jgi:hypothetical protein